MEQVTDAYGYWAGRVVDVFNTKGQVAPCLLSLNFLSSGGFDCTFIDEAYVTESLKTESGQFELRKFTTGLLNDSILRQDMISKGFKPADAVVFISEIEIRSANGKEKPVNEGILVVVHTPGAIYRGLCPILNEPLRHAEFGGMSLDASPSATDSALAPVISSEMSEILTTRDKHDIHHLASKMQ